MSHGKVFPEFDRSRLLLLPLMERKHDLDITAIRPLEPVSPVHKELETVAERIITARAKKASIIMMSGAHVLRSGVQRHIIDLMEKGFISCVALNGGGVIHDFELALIGATTESVGHYIQDGRFGLWKETGRLNDIVKDGVKKGMGLGEAVGRIIEEERFPYKDISLLAAGWRLGIPITVHVGIGYDIVHEHPNFDGAAYGEASYRDFLRLAWVLDFIEGGVVMNFGSAVMGPEVYLKALAMVRNVAAREGRPIRHFTTLVCDQKELKGVLRAEPSRMDPDYFFRPWKTMLVRTVTGGGESYYVRGHHDTTIPGLWSAIQLKTDSPRGGP